jgi:signal transduction histidine kinase
MRALTGAWRARAAQSLSYRVLLYTLLWSLLITSIAVAVQLYTAYRVELGRMQTRLDDIERAYVPSLSASVWAVDRPHIALMLDSIARLPDVHSASITSPDDAAQLRTIPGAGAVLMQRGYALEHTLDKVYSLGRLEVQLGDGAVFQRLRQRAVGIAVVQGLTIFLVSLFVYGLVQRLIATRLRAMADYARTLDVDTLDTPLVLPGQRADSDASKDEIVQVAQALNRMREGFRAQIDERNASQRELARHRDHLEELVAERTETVLHQSHALRAARDQAQSALAHVRATQQKLVEAAKMASLGQLVAGVAHEVNTPLGIALTAGSYLAAQSTALQQQLSAGALSKTTLREFTQDSERAASLIVRNLERAAKLVQNFKQVSVDHSSDGRRVFELDGFIHSLTESLKTLWKHRPIAVEVHSSFGVMLDSFPGALGTVLTSLLQNALSHGLSDSQSGTIRISSALIEPETPSELNASDSAPDRSAEWVCLTVSDTGAGIAPEHLGKVFEPFFTTSRGSGAIGLGLHIAYNLVTQKLGGSITVQSGPQGSAFEIRLPKMAPLAHSLVEPVAVG